MLRLLWFVNYIHIISNHKHSGYILTSCLGKDFFLCYETNKKYQFLSTRIYNYKNKKKTASERSILKETKHKIILLRIAYHGELKYTMVF